VEALLETLRAEHDPLASHIFVSRRQYRNANDTKGGKHREMNARLSFNSLGAGLSRKFGRMGAVDGCGCATVIATVHMMP
jgi:hypothetical protein